MPPHEEATEPQSRLEFALTTIRMGAPAKYLLALLVALLALGLRMAVLPVEAGLAFLIFYPSTAVVALLCGLRPSVLYIAVSALTGTYIFLPPAWGFSADKLLPSCAYVLSASTILLVIYFYQRRVARQTQVLTREMVARESTAVALRHTLDQHDKLEHAFRQTFEQAAVGLAHVSLKGHWLRINQKLCDIVAYNRDELLNMTFQDITFPADLDADLAFVMQMLSGEIDHYTMEKRYLRKGGGIVWVNLTVSMVRRVDGSPDYFIAVIEEISRRKNAEEALALSEQKFSMAFSANPAAIALTRVEDGLFVEVNETWVELSGYTREESIGHSGRAMHIWPTPERAAEFTQSLRDRGTVRGWEQSFNKKNGEIYIAQLSAQLLRVGGEDHVLSTLVDITASKHAEQEIRNLNASLERRVMERTEKLERINHDLDDFAYIASHDLKEPLRGLHNYASFLQEDYAEKLDDEGKRYLERMQRLVERLSALIDGLLSYSRLGSTDLPQEPVALDQVLDEVLEDLRVFLKEKNVTLVRESTLPTVVCNAMWVREVFQNLITNAAKYNDKDDKRIEIGTRGGANPVLCVRDNGIGIAPQHEDTIFRIFKRLHEQNKFGGGTGAGLTIVKKIIERHGGRIWLESQLGEGTSFCFTLHGDT